MRILTTAVLLTALAATPALAATTTSTSWEGTSAEMQKQGPYSNVYGPSRNGVYVITNNGRRAYYRSHRHYRYYR